MKRTELTKLLSVGLGESSESVFGSSVGCARRADGMSAFVDLPGDTARVFFVALSRSKRIEMNQRHPKQSDNT